MCIRDSDNSPDGTSSIVSQKEESFKNRVFLIKRLDKKGLGTAYIEGIRWALKRKYDFIVSVSHEKEFAVGIVIAKNYDRKITLR